MNLKLNTPIEVTRLQYNVLKIYFAGIIAYRTDGEKYWIQIWIPGYTKEIEKVLSL